jgi:hypothetical protein
MIRIADLYLHYYFENENDLQQLPCTFWLLSRGLLAHAIKSQNTKFRPGVLNCAHTINMEGYKRTRSYSHSHAKGTVTETTSPRRGVGTTEV